MPPDVGPGGSEDPGEPFRRMRRFRRHYRWLDAPPDVPDATTLNPAPGASVSPNSSL